MDKVGGRNKTDDLLAAFRKKISDRIDRGERKEVHAASDRPSPDEALDASERRSPLTEPPKRTRKAMLAPGPGRSRSPEVRGSLRNTEERKRQLLDGPLEPEVARTASKVDEERPVRPDGERRRQLLDGPLEPEMEERRRPRPDREKRPRREHPLDRVVDEPLRETRRKAPSPVESKERLGRGGRLAEKRTPKEVQKAKGRDMASHGTFSRPRTIKVTDIPKGLEWRYIKELFESAAGKVVEGHLEKNGTVAWLTFEKPDAASEAHFEFDGGELADQPIRVELIDDDD